MGEIGVPPAVFQQAYDGRPPWDTGRPQPALIALASQVRGSVLDAGCGTGEHALFYAAQGREAWGVDVVPGAIEKARTKAAERGLAATFKVGNALALAELGRTFDTVIDSGLFHTLSDTDRPRYVDGLRLVLNPGGVVHLLCFSELTPGTMGPRRVTQAEVRAAFAAGWVVRDITQAEFEVTDPNRKPQAWRAVIERSP